MLEAGSLKKAIQLLAIGIVTQAGSNVAVHRGIAMHELTEAYQCLLAYCKEYRFPLMPGEDQPLDGEDWWMDRFGDDPLWSPKRYKK